MSDDYSGAGGRARESVILRNADAIERGTDKNLKPDLPGTDNSVHPAAKAAPPASYAPSGPAHSVTAGAPIDAPILSGG